MAGSITAYGDGNGTTYSSISPRTTAYVVKDLLERGAPYLVFEKFGQAKPIPEKHSQVIKFRRYFLNYGTFSFGSGNADVYNPAQYYASTGENGLFTVGSGVTGRKVLTEGVTPNPTKLDSEDISATLVQYGDYTTISDVILDTHEDPVLQEAIAIVGEQAAYMVELIRYGVLAASTNAFYAGGTSTDTVDEKLTLTFQRKITRALKRQLAKPITSVVKSTALFGTEPIAPSYIGIAHPDCESDIRDMTGFVPAEKYGSVTPFEGEIGKVEDVRYLTSTVIQVAASSGAAVGSTGLTTTDASNIDVYPIIYLGKDAYGLVPLKGKNAISPMVHNPTVSDSDPLAQRGHVGWKTWQTAVILNPAWMAVARVGVTAL
jgi:N4-gp56 family major capsid protein